ncbi:hypothetical protein L596_017734 [Steinernema carpocapsae]|uniref:Uncharacterized protein n=1 Tax=Steinernema carpocapsae TaxID=34508 RepID=A0A4U5N2W5_STECR|nr:hypothetical protein L596_017734 [Steinernema carpocapsae]
MRIIHGLKRAKEEIYKAILIGLRCLDAANFNHRFQCFEPNLTETLNCLQKKQASDLLCLQRNLEIYGVRAFLGSKPDCYALPGLYWNLVS